MVLEGKGEDKDYLKFAKHNTIRYKLEKQLHKTKRYYDKAYMDQYILNINQ